MSVGVTAYVAAMARCFRRDAFNVLNYMALPADADKRCNNGCTNRLQ